MQTTQSISCNPLVPWLQKKASNVYTQFGEDGLIEAVFDRIGETNRQCFEIGAADGVFYSNTLRLRELGWKALLIESDVKRYLKLEQAFGNQSICILALIKELNHPLLNAGFETTPDLGVIDIDGQDYYLWESLTVFKPRVMLVEINPDAHEPLPPRNEPGQAGLTVIQRLGESKGYTLVATTFCNALFVDSSCL